ncbi:MAG: hypothetical protein VB032_08645 [Burkholderiaceae bacterium]|nr:hypothetical protein [Burkholderiaceae bacterium]
MAGQIGAVVFADSARLYLVYDGTMDIALRPLFPTEQAARDWLVAGMPVVAKPNEAEPSDEAVTVIVDLALEADGELGLAGHFPSRASKENLWLTGPRSFLEMAYQNGATACREF